MRTPTIDDVVQHVAAHHDRDPAAMRAERPLGDAGALAVYLADAYTGAPRRELVAATGVPLGTLQRALRRIAERRRDDPAYRAATNAIEDALADRFPHPAGDLDA